ncbi:hypothetical protein H2508_12910 [Parahaliea sp. F7430]|uniref:Uncharacterized protein n=1 Tax=Sediminihaliea albiluteola TaxID=2758564 RepID=A0A7W2TXZ8_9GAMM|nr:hypothetical protein [Sediminihaliea albiluteola]MBA6414013.1 hypothetical protein [Sediminihaliea albiluteola]
MSLKRLTALKLLPDAVVDEALANLGRKPIHVAGQHNLAAATALRSARDRAEAILYMGQAAAELYGKPYPPKA